MAERRTVLTILLTIVSAFVLLGAWIYAPRTTAVQETDFTEVTDPAALQSMVQLTRPSIATSENYVGHRIRLIYGSLKNVSDKSIRMIEVKMAFTDFDGKPVQEGVYQAFEPKQRPLKPGTEYRFEIAFEGLPRTWNYRVPVMQIVKVAH